MKKITYMLLIVPKGRVGFFLMHNENEGRVGFFLMHSENVLKNMLCIHVTIKNDTTTY